MQRDLLERIKTQMPQMSKGHKRIASYILEHCEKASYLTATKLGVNTGVSESTVVRFAIELGFKGYPEFQSNLQASMKSKLTSVQRIAVADDMIGDKDVLTSVLESDSGNIKSTLESLDREAFDKAVELIAGAREIYIIGVRSSSMLASFMYYYLDLIFPNVHLIQTTSNSEMFERVRRVSTGDVMIGITFPRYSYRAKDAVEFAKKRGAGVIAITDCDNSPISYYADSALYAKSDMMSFVDSLVAPLSVINALIVAVGRKNKVSLDSTFRELEQIWEEYNVYEKPKG